MNCGEIINAYLRENGFDGLYAPDVPCGCLLSDELRPCGFDGMDCKPGYKVECKPEECEGCGFVCDGYIAGAFRVQGERP